jgi:hypothetical protein
MDNRKPSLKTKENNTKRYWRKEILYKCMVMMSWYGWNELTPMNALCIELKIVHSNNI